MNDLAITNQLMSLRDYVMRNAENPEDDVMALNTAIDIINRYQSIKQIVGSEEPTIPNRSR